MSFETTKKILKVRGVKPPPNSRIDSVDVIARWAYERDRDMMTAINNLADIAKEMQDWLIANT